MTRTATGPLAGLLVLDFGQAAVGPIAAQYLGMMGATVVKVESPKGDTVRHGKPTMKGTGTTFIGNNVTKYGMVLDLKSADGHAAARRLIALADVLIENFRSSAIMPRLGLGYDVLKELNPGLVYVSASAYGRGGPLENMRSNEWLSEALSGFTSVSGAAGTGGEFSRGSANLDWNGAMVNTVVLLAGLVRRGRGAGGGFFATSQLGSTIFGGMTRFAEVMSHGPTPVPAGSRHPAMAPDEVFRTADGWVAISAPTQRIWERLAIALGVDAARFPDNAARLAGRDELHNTLETVTLTRPGAHWVEVLATAQVPCARFAGPASLLGTLAGNAQIAELGLVGRIPSGYGDVATQQPHWVFERTPASIEKGPPQFDEHTELVLENLDSKEALLTALQTAGSAA
jgi:crotonobetainyl-CoA:carnitine CoA-transferase CaiB-like acyl-CoA transferase